MTHRNLDHGHSIVEIDLNLLRLKEIGIVYEVLEKALGWALLIELKKKTFFKYIKHIKLL